VGHTWTAIATNKLNIRIFTLTGVQLYLLSVPGQVVSMSGHGSQLLIVYHAGNPLPSEQSLAFKLLDLSTQQQIVADQRVTLSKKTTLVWLG
jgi:chromosome transmission fidelity protein 4